MESISKSFQIATCPYYDFSVAIIKDFYFFIFHGHPSLSTGAEVPAYHERNAPLYFRLGLLSDARLQEYLV